MKSYISFRASRSQSGFVNRKPKAGNRKRGARIRRISPSSSALLCILILFAVSCGKQRARVEAPRPPAPAGPGGQRPPETSAPPEAPGGETGRTTEPGTETSIAPNIAIGLTVDASEVRIAARGDYYVRKNEPEAAQVPVRGNIHVRVERGGDSGALEPCYRIQVLSLRNRDSAETLREQLEKTYKVPAILSANSDATSNRVRVGEFPAREQAQELLQTLKGAGYPDAFIIEDVASRSGGKTALTLQGPNGLTDRSISGFLFLPSTESSFLSCDGKAYRGTLEVRLNGGNRITVVNRLGIEDYLRGVVPAEMSPTEYPQFDALAAQSIAARTYALKHMGQFQSQGFDLTDDTRTQAYGGVASEKDATDEALRRTTGLAIYYDGGLIDAMYMSTCGGRTEDFSAVFDAKPVPYLKSVVCATENSVHDDATVVSGSHNLDAPIYADDGSVANRDLELARTIGVWDGGTPLTPSYLDGILTQDEARRLIAATRSVLGMDPNPSDSAFGNSGADTRIGFLKSAAELLFGPDQIGRSISASDAAYYVGNLEDSDAVPEPARRALAFLIQKSLWSPFPDNTARPDEPIRRYEGISLLVRWAESIQPGILRQGIFAGADDSQEEENSASGLRIKWGNSARNFRLARNLPLFRRESGRKIPVQSVRIIGNEKTYFHLDADGDIDFLEVALNPTGASSDRYSPSATWETTFTRSDIGGKVRSLAGNIGELRDLEPAKFGKSGRVVQIRLIGSRSSTVVNGYKFRGALGLRDTLFTITREKDPAGGIAAFTFHGRGFGHGIGLCQVGAFGMAKAGKSYEEILKTYYQGVEIRKAY